MASGKGLSISIKTIIGMLIALITVVLLASLGTKYTANLADFVTGSVFSGLFG